MKKRRDGGQADLERRKFLGGSAAVSAGVAAMSVLPAQAAVDRSGGDQEEKEQKGYRLSDHILSYYKSAAS